MEFQAARFWRDEKRLGEAFLQSNKEGLHGRIGMRAEAFLLLGP
jgi:hypothetical protein